MGGVLSGFARPRQGGDATGAICAGLAPNEKGATLRPPLQ